MTPGNPDIAIAMSGGVDSSVAAALVVESGRTAFGVTMRLGLAEIAGRPCCGEEEALLAKRVCAELGIPHVVVDVSDEFRAEVVEPFCEAYASGLTPNPCVRCNERIKLGLLAERVRAMGAKTLVTGHYARVVRASGRAWIARGADPRKDQSYFLYRVRPEVLDMLELPLGDLTKAEVREMAAARGLATALRRESQEVCFTDDHAALVSAAHPDAVRPGPIEDLEGNVVGTHRGIARYTVGQRKGLGVSGQAEPWVVLAIDTARNALVVGPAASGLTTSVILENPVWRGASGRTRLLAQVRYRATPLPVTVEAGADTLTVEFDEPTGPLAPGQSLVLYEGDRVVGGGLVPALSGR